MDSFISSNFEIMMITDGFIKIYIKNIIFFIFLFFANLTNFNNFKKKKFQNYNHI